MKIYIDGENFRKNLKNILLESGTMAKNAVLKKYPIRDLLVDVLEVDDLEIIYYASKIKLPTNYTPSKKTLSVINDIKQESRVWLANIVQQKIQLVKAGNLKIKDSKPCRSCGKKQETLQEKGVDVRLAVDLLEDVYERKASPIGIFSSDTDLCPALHKVVSKRVQVVYICFASSVNRAVSAVATQTVAISVEKVKKYYEGK